MTQTPHESEVTENGQPVKHISAELHQYNGPGLPPDKPGVLNFDGWYNATPSGTDKELRETIADFPILDLDGMNTTLGKMLHIVSDYLLDDVVDLIKSRDAQRDKAIELAARKEGENFGRVDELTKISEFGKSIDDQWNSHFEGRLATLKAQQKGNPS